MTAVAACSDTAHLRTTSEDEVTNEVSTSSGHGIKRQLDSDKGSVNFQPNVPNKKRPRPLKKRTSFGFAEIMEFEPTVHTASVPSDGPPMGMSMVVRCSRRLPIDSFELERGSPRCSGVLAPKASPNVFIKADPPQVSKQRINRQEFMSRGYLAKEERKCILAPRHRLASFEDAELECSQIQAERRLSNLMDDNFDHTDYGWEVDEEDKECGGYLRGRSTSPLCVNETETFHHDDGDEYVDYEYCEASSDRSVGISDLF